MNARIIRWTNERINEWINEWTDQWMNQWLNGSMNERINEWIKWMSGSMDERINWWMNERITLFPLSSSVLSSPLPFSPSLKSSFFPVSTSFFFSQMLCSGCFPLLFHSLRFFLFHPIYPISISPFASSTFHSLILHSPRSLLFLTPPFNAFHRFPSSVE